MKIDLEKLKWLILMALIVILLGFIVYVGIQVFQKDSLVDGRYKAVFLSNGQVYFGKIIDNRETQLILTEIYYLKANQLDGRAEDLELIKLGSEVHQPEDLMYLNPDHVMFIEPVKSNSKILEAINNYNSQ